MFAPVNYLVALAAEKHFIDGVCHIAEVCAVWYTISSCSCFLMCADAEE